jgi:feruloyl esterase
VTSEITLARWRAAALASVLATMFGGGLAVTAVRATDADTADAAIGARSCEGLASLRLPQTAITAASLVAHGAFQPPGGRGGAAYASLPTFCRVAVTLTPSSDSDIKVEVWLPAAGWNGKYQAVGNGGWAGTIGYAAMARALAKGYATSGTDTGHVGNSGEFALGHPEKFIDYAYRSEHAMVVAAKKVVQALYDREASQSYFNGCSTGGRQALVEAQRYPDDFDGIIAGAAANPKTHLDAWRLAMSQAMFKDAASLIPPAKYPAIHQAVLSACDALDGARDGLIEDPVQCRFDPKVLLCTGPDGPTCLTAPQVESARVAMSPAKNRTGAEIFPGFEAGNELGWELLLGGPEPYSTAVDTFRYVIFQNPTWDWRTFSLERDVAEADRAAKGTLSPVDPNLSAFAAHGGRLLMYHGWADQDIAPRASVNFYLSTRQATRPPATNADWVRLFMVPGMQHCSGGEGPDTFDTVAALEAWVEQGRAPASMPASHSTNGRVDRTRPLCPYPQVARYSGRGSLDEAANFACATR